LSATTQIGRTVIGTGGTYGFDPRIVSGCELWLDGSYSGNIVVSGGNVSTWNNQSIISTANVTGSSPYPQYPSTTSKGINFSNGYLSGETSAVGDLTTTDFAIFAIVYYSPVSPTANQYILSKGSNWSLWVDGSNKVNFLYSSSSPTSTTALTSGLNLISVMASRTTTYYITNDNWASGTTSTIRLSLSLGGPYITFTQSITSGVGNVISSGRSAFPTSTFIISSVSGVSMNIKTRTNTGSNGFSLQYSTVTFTGLGSTITDISSAGSTQIYTNGTLNGVDVSTTATTLTTTSKIYVGTDSTNAYPWTGDIGEVLIYNDNATSQIINTNRQQQIEGYLAWKWGIQGQLPSSVLYDPTNNPSTKPWLMNFRPTDCFSTCYMWFDGADETSITTNSSNQVTTWINKANTAKNATCTASSNVTHTTGTPGVNFSSGIMSTKLNSQIGSQDLFVVFNATNYSSRRTTGDYCNVLVGSTVGGTNGGSFGPGFNIGGTTTTANQIKIETPFGSNGTSNAVYTTSTFNTVNNYLVSFSTGSDGTPTTTNIYDAGYAYTSANGSVVYYGANDSNQTIALGGWTYTSSGSGGGGPCYFNGTILEIIMFVKSGNVGTQRIPLLTTPERQQIEGYLSWKWGPLGHTLPSGHPFAKFPPATVVPYPAPGNYAV